MDCSGATRRTHVSKICTGLITEGNRDGFAVSLQGPGGARGIHSRLLAPARRTTLGPEQSRFVAIVLARLTRLFPNLVWSSRSPKNPFVHLAIQSTLLLASALSSSTVFSSLMVTIVGSNDFYSQARTVSCASTTQRHLSATTDDALLAPCDQDAEPEPFAPLGVKLKDVHKTGLGSSAAMVTSLCAALLLHWDSQSSSSSASKTATSALPDSLPSSPTILSSSPPPPALFPQPTHAETPDKDTLSLIHNLAQYVHSLAQGKVGSGFDVSAAVYGSHVYRRFAVECLNDLLNEAVNADEVGSHQSGPENTHKLTTVCLWFAGR